MQKKDDCWRYDSSKLDNKEENTLKQTPEPTERTNC